MTVEPSVIGSGHKILFQFNNAITSTGTVASTDGSGFSIGSASAAAVGNTIEVTLTGIADNKRVKVSLFNVNGALFNTSASMGFLVGDVTNTRSVASDDIAAIKGHAGEAASAPNYLYDLNLSGAITAADILAAKGRVGFAVP